MKEIFVGAKFDRRDVEMRRPRDRLNERRQRETGRVDRLCGFFKELLAAIFSGRSVLTERLRGAAFFATTARVAERFAMRRRRRYARRLTRRAMTATT